jgi:Ca-activated chloride channel family protein
VLSSDVREDVIAREFEALQAAPSVASGGGAVDAAVGQAALENADVVDGAVDDMAQILKNVGNRTFLNVDGVWTDTQFDPATMTTTLVQFASDDYFALAAARPDLGAALALGQRVIVLTEGVAYEVVPEETDPLTLPATVEPTPTSPEATVVPTTPATPSPVNTPVPPANGGGFCATVLMPLFLLGSVVVLRRKK